MHIRTANSSDLERIAELESRCFPPAEGATLASFANRLACYPNHFWLLETDDKLAAMVNGMVSDAPHLTDEMYDDASLHSESGRWQMIFGVATAPEYRRRGFAEALLRRAIQDARAQGRRGLVLTCKDALVPYYAKFGFQDEGMSDSTHGGVPWHEMRLTFPAQTP